MSNSKSCEEPPAPIPADPTPTSTEVGEHPMPTDSAFTSSVAPTTAFGNGSNTQDHSGMGSPTLSDSATSVGVVDDALTLPTGSLQETLAPPDPTAVLSTSSSTSSQSEKHSFASYTEMFVSFITSASFTGYVSGLSVVGESKIWSWLATNPSPSADSIVAPFTENDEIVGGGGVPTIWVTTQSGVKVVPFGAAVAQWVWQKLGVVVLPRVVGFKVSSGQREQPLGEETIEGARFRMKEMKLSPYFKPMEGDILVSVESGFMVSRGKFAGNMVDFAIAVVQQYLGDGKYSRMITVMGEETCPPELDNRSETKTLDGLRAFLLSEGHRLSAASQLRAQDNPDDLTVGQWLHAIDPFKYPDPQDWTEAAGGLPRTVSLKMAVLTGLVKSEESEGEKDGIKAGMAVGWRAGGRL